MTALFTGSSANLTASGGGTCTLEYWRYNSRNNSYTINHDDLTVTVTNGTIWRHSDYDSTVIDPSACY
ncbi:MAG: hypothetical protein IPO48_14925 [Saprospiraceae bacterium]|nr:hypothetical protein [Saprospiraceae bacterium]